MASYVGRLASRVRLSERPNASVALARRAPTIQDRGPIRNEQSDALNDQERVTNDAERTAGEISRWRKH